MCVRNALVQPARKPPPIIAIAMLMSLVLGNIHCGMDAPTTPDSSPTKLSFSVGPTSVIAGAAIAPAVRATVQDAQGNTVISSTVTITLAISSGTGTAGAVLGGTPSRAAVNGVATFNDLTIDRAGTGYTLTAAAMSLASATSTVFDVMGIPTSISLRSDPNDYIGGGRTYQYTKAGAIITVGASGGHLSLGITGDESWFADFQEPNSVTQLQPGMYSNLTRYPFHDPAVGGLAWSGEGRGCNTLTGWFAIDGVTYRNGNLAVIDLRFEQHCEGQSPALHGTIHWNADDPTMLSGPVYPIPAGLWQPAAGSTPAMGNYVYLVSDVSDYIGLGQTLTYTPTNAIISVTAEAAHLSIGVSEWFGDFQAMVSLSGLRPGYYADLRRYPFHNPARGGLNWSGQGRGCNTLTGWFAIDGVTYRNGNLAVIDLRFEQHCEGSTPALHGAIHWDVDDLTMPPGPVYPIPAGLWQPAAGSTPAMGNYVYLASDAGDYIGQGQTLTYSPTNATISVAAVAAHLSITVSGWFGDFQAMVSLSDLQPGYYPDLHRYPFHNPARGGLNWSGQGRGCNTLSGWFVVDALTYSSGTLTAIDLRFEQHCDGSTPALHGAIHWQQ